MTAPETEVPSLSLPRSELLAYAMAARMVSGALRARREANGRAAWADDEHGARMELAADAAAIDLLTPTQAEQWNRIVADGDADSVRHDPAGMVVSHADLPDGSQVVQGVLGDRVVTVAAGSAETGQHVREWLADSPTHDRLTDLRAVAKDIADDRAAALALDTDSKVRADDDLLTGATPHADQDQEQQSQTLADRLDGRIPARVFDDPRWGLAEKRFAEYTSAGADPDALADAVAGLSFDAKVRTPAGLAAWQLHRTMKGMKEPATEDQARREAAVEWLATEAGNGPDDRARAARLIGQFDEAFDAQLADKYPGLLNAADAQLHDHNGRSASEDDLAAQHEQTAERADDEHLAVIANPDADEHRTNSPEGAELAEDRDSDYGMAVDHEHTAADEQANAQQTDSDRSEIAAEPVHAAAAPLATVGPAASQGQSRAKAIAARPARTQQKTQTRARPRTS
ncbi:hypothetical protein BH683_007245 [Williamsia sp. 1138]|uniref:hypothetical protein n=1 Tax=Williamsia sp. 1138 TaxID=1903117 RepID=UPI000A110B2B|nr:hypothetical protein [Williamsia sp. 1138]OZG29726.1 hypothetical protein BH683_007245 [Williamsia sp. 1138]